MPLLNKHIRIPLPQMGGTCVCKAKDVGYDDKTFRIWTYGCTNILKLGYMTNKNIVVVIHSRHRVMQMKSR